MTRKDKQNEVFELIKNKYREQGHIDDHDIYYILQEYGFKEKDKVKREKKYLFDFKGQVKTKGLIANMEEIPFIPFSDSISDTEYVESAVKMYIPVDAKHLKETYLDLNSYMKKNNIKSNSKARNRAANDDIVLRLFDRNSVETMKNYIKGNPNIRKSIIDTNPFFAHDELGIGYSMDGKRTSVNNELSMLLSRYVNSTDINNVNRDGFKEYLRESKIDFYRRYPNIDLFNVEGNRVRNLIELSMDDSFDYNEMMKYASVMQGFKENLKRMNIRDLSGFVFGELSRNHKDYEVVNMMGNIETLSEKDFGSPFLYMLSKIYLTQDTVLDYFSSISRNDLERNNKKIV